MRYLLLLGVWWLVLPLCCQMLNSTKLTSLSFSPTPNGEELVLPVSCCITLYKWVWFVWQISDRSLHNLWRDFTIHPYELFIACFVCRLVWGRMSPSMSLLAILLCCCIRNLASSLRNSAWISTTNICQKNRLSVDMLSCFVFNDETSVLDKIFGTFS